MRRRDVVDRAGDADAVRRLRREADIIGALTHPNICAVDGIYEHDGQPFIAMERVDGVTVKTRVTSSAPLETREIVRIACAVADALGAAHTAGIVHRDIKSTNIMVARDGTVKVLDFGLARRFRREDATGDVLGSTIPGRPIGTANYMAPERILQLPLDPRSDLFSLGVVLFEMATGQLPFAGESPYETVVKVLEQPAPTLRTLAPERPRRLEQVVDRLLAKEAGARCQSAAEVHRILASLAGTDVRGPLGRIRTLFTRD